MDHYLATPWKGLMRGEAVRCWVYRVWSIQPARISPPRKGVPRPQQNKIQLFTGRGMGKMSYIPSTLCLLHHNFFFNQICLLWGPCGTMKTEANKTAYGKWWEWLNACLLEKKKKRNTLLAREGCSIRWAPWLFKCFGFFIQCFVLVYMTQSKDVLVADRSLTSRKQAASFIWLPLRSLPFC